MNQFFRRTGRAVTLCVLVALAGCASYSLVPPSTSLGVAKSALHVSPGQSWNRVLTTMAPYMQGKTAQSEYWTADGNLLNLLSFHGGVAPGETLFRPVSKQERPMPPFKADMTLADLPEWVESSLRLRSTNTTVQMGEIKPVTFAGQSGVQCDFTFVDESEVQRRGRVAATIKGGQLFLILFEAVSPVYFDRRIAEVEQIIASATIG